MTLKTNRKPIVTRTYNEMGVTLYRPDRNNTQSCQCHNCVLPYRSTVLFRLDLLCSVECLLYRVKQIYIVTSHNYLQRTGVASFNRSAVLFCSVTDLFCSPAHAQCEDQVLDENMVLFICIFIFDVTTRKRICRYYSDSFTSPQVKFKTE